MSNRKVHGGIVAVTDVMMFQLPAVSTPQFSWVLSRLPERAQPVPPIYQPEVAIARSRTRQLIGIGVIIGLARAAVGLEAAKS